ncbi:SAM-dependent methyltransferase [Aporhodopirellula aestuarii]|uniref:YiiD C-terminal domain-containing protein n=1 Tax=Aporhodopirellula aestuarii TaxID=2950107 RepID=A0ABT0TZC2_9BACT|nr:SAM-dependent methyltransferase [Aporhodopirellula aestuarii]MCM2369912.1 YiiD C-terminal domain-containing protein [Aporhodopirellula aestuarii]
MVASQFEGHLVTWEEDYSNRVNPELMTSLLHDAIPVLRSVGWRVTEVREGACVSELPLCFASTNQHGTHQAALISLSADYTGGLALATLLRGIPLAGVHRCKEENSASLWLAAMDVKYRSPSTGHLRASCVVPEDVARTIQQRYFAGKRVLVTLTVKFTSNNEVVAEAEMKYFAQPSIQLLPTKQQPRISPLFAHKLKASARMIAGLRASFDDRGIRVDVGHERDAAGPHGALLANRLKGVLPQLQNMVKARTAHIDQTLESVEGLKQVVILGVGLDMRPFRLFDRLGQPTFFELDLPEMLEERTRVISQMKDRPMVSRRMIAADFKTDNLAKLLHDHPDFDPSLPTVFVYEGCSMYFTEEENREILTLASSLCQHTDSRLWCDIVAQSVVDGTSEHTEIIKFVEGMDELGERFIFGSDTPSDFLASCGFEPSESITAGEYLGASDRAFSTYRFAVCHGKVAVNRC